MAVRVVGWSAFCDCGISLSPIPFQRSDTTTQLAGQQRVSQGDTDKTSTDKTSDGHKIDMTKIRHDK